PSGTLLMGTGSVPLDAVRAPVHSVSPGAPSFVGDAWSPSSPATGQSPFVPTAQQPAAGHEAQGAAPVQATVNAHAPNAAHVPYVPAQHVPVGPGVQCGRYMLEKKLGEG